jgi:arylsulfatase
MRRSTILILLALTSFFPRTLAGQETGQEKPKPNIVFILADDLGYGELGCYGQEKIKTPNIDGLAKQGIKFTQHYTGAPVCAPARCVLMTGQHLGHAEIRGNRDSGNGRVFPGQFPITDEVVTIAEVLKDAGYTNGGGLVPPTQPAHR